MTDIGKAHKIHNIYLKVKLYTFIFVFKYDTASSPVFKFDLIFNFKLIFFKSLSFIFLDHHYLLLLT